MLNHSYNHYIILSNMVMNAKMYRIYSSIYFLTACFVFAMIFNLAKSEYVEAAAKKGAKYGDWHLSCEENKKCVLSQILQLEDKNNTKVAEYRIGYFGSDKLKLLNILPFGVNLKQGPTLYGNQDVLAEGEYTTCQAYGCIAYINLDEEILNKIYNAEKSYIAIKTVENKNLNIRFSAKGLKDAIKALQ